MRFTRKTKNIFISVVSVLLIFGVVAGSLSFFGAFKKKDDNLKEIKPKFEVGGLTETGKYKETKFSLYTKEHFPCKGLEIVPDFDARLSYQVFFYDSTDNFIPSASSVLTEGEDFSVPGGAEYARIVITPIWDNDVEQKDKELDTLDCIKYSGKLTVKILDASKLSRDELYKCFYGMKAETEYPVSNLSAPGSNSTIAFKDVSLFDNKCITKIDVALKSFTGENPYFTILVLKDSVVKVGGSYSDATCRKYRVYIPEEYLDESVAPTWISIDLVDYNINIAADETLGFLVNGDACVLGQEFISSDNEVLETEATMYYLLNSSGVLYSHYLPITVYGYDI